MKLLIISIMDTLVSKKNLLEYAKAKQPQFHFMKKRYLDSEIETYLFGNDHINRIKDIIKYVPKISIWILNDTMYHENHLLNILERMDFPLNNLKLIINHNKEKSKILQAVKKYYNIKDVLYVGCKKIPGLPFVKVKETAGITDTEKNKVISYFLKCKHITEVARSLYDEFYHKELHYWGIDKCNNQ